LATVKTTLVLDEKIWSEFRRFVEAAYGTTRKMSAGVEEALGSFTPVAVLEAFCVKRWNCLGLVSFISRDRKSKAEGQGIDGENDQTDER